MYGKMQASGLTGFILCTSAVHACQVLSCVQPFVSYGLWPARLLCPWDSPGNNTWVDCHTHLQGLFLTQGSNPVSCVSCIAVVFFTTEPPRLNPVSYQHKVWQMWWMAASCIPLKLLCNHLGAGGSICWIPGSVPFWEPSFTLRGQISLIAETFLACGYGRK